MKTVEQLLHEARALLPYRCSPEETLNEIEAGTLVIDIRGDEQQRQDGLIPGTIVIRRNVLEWRCDPVSPCVTPKLFTTGKKSLFFATKDISQVLLPPTSNDLAC